MIRLQRNLYDKKFIENNIIVTNITGPKKPCSWCKFVKNELKEFKYSFINRAINESRLCPLSIGVIIIAAIFNIIKPIIYNSTFPYRIIKGINTETLIENISMLKANL